MQNPYLMEMLAAEHRAQRLAEAERRRLLAAAPATVSRPLAALLCVARVLRRHPLLSFIILAFGITWGLGACFALFPAPIAATFGPASLHNPLFLLAVYAPSISALVMSAVVDGLRGVARLLARYLRWRVGLRWYAAVLLGLPALSALALLLNAAATRSMPPLAHWYDLFLLGPSGREISHLLQGGPGGWHVVIAMLLIVFVSDPGPLGEELGWRGYALPIMLQQRSRLSAGLLLGVIWGAWHLPAFFVAGLPQNSISIPLFMVSIVALSILMTWVFQGAGGSLLTAVLLHAMFNTFMDLTNVPLALASAGVLVIAALVVAVTAGPMRAPVGCVPNQALGSAAVRDGLGALPIV